MTTSELTKQDIVETGAAIHTKTFTAPSTGRSITWAFCPWCDALRASFSGDTEARAISYVKRHARHDHGASFRRPRAE